MGSERIASALESDPWRFDASRWERMMRSAYLSCAGLLITLGFASSPAQAALYDFSFVEIGNPTKVYGSGQLTVSPNGAGFTATSATGTIHDGYLPSTDFVINGLSSYAGADNILYFPAVQSTSGAFGPINGYVDFGGISFTTTTPGQEFNLGGGGTALGAPYYDVLNDSRLNPVGYGIGSSGQAQGSYDISLSASLHLVASDALSPSPSPGPTPGLGLASLAFLALLGAAEFGARRKQAR